jgi:hypothetical protein
LLLKSKKMKTKIFFLFALMPVLVFGQLPCSGYQVCGILSATVNGHSVLLKDDTAHRNCGSVYVMEISSISADTLIWIQKDIAGGAICDCYFNLSVTIDSLKTGNYFTKVFLTDTYWMDTCYVGSLSFTISQPFSYFSPFPENPYQSPCFTPGVGIRSDNLSPGINLRIFPNPTKSVLNVVTNLKGPKVITISDIENKRILELNTDKEENSIDLNTLPNQMYLITVRNNEKSLHAKFFKN